MSVSLRLWLLLRASSVPPRVSCLASSPSCFGSERGRNQKGKLEMSRRADDTRKPIHHAPTQRASLGVMVTLSGWRKRVSGWVHSRKTVCLIFHFHLEFKMSIPLLEGTRLYLGKKTSWFRLIVQDGTLSSSDAAHLWTDWVRLTNKLLILPFLSVRIKTYSSKGLRKVLPNLSWQVCSLFLWLHVRTLYHEQSQNQSEPKTHHIYSNHSS